MAPVSAISVDVNPSIELGVNRFDRIVTVEGYNADGAALAASVELQNLNYPDALAALLSSEEMRSQIASCAYAAQPNVECQCGNREQVAAI